MVLATVDSSGKSESRSLIAELATEASFLGDLSTADQLQRHRKRLTCLGQHWSEFRFVGAGCPFRTNRRAGPSASLLTYRQGVQRGFVQRTRCSVCEARHNQEGEEKKSGEVKKGRKELLRKKNRAHGLQNADDVKATTS